MANKEKKSLNNDSLTTNLSVKDDNIKISNNDIDEINDKLKKINSKSDSFEQNSKRKTKSNHKKQLKKDFKSLSKEERQQLKNRIKEIHALNNPHKGPKKVEMPEDAAIILKDVVKYYTNGYLVSKILKGVNLEIKKGDFVIILGPSGSGKTTLMNIISGLDRASDGETLVAGYNLINMNQKELTDFRRENIGYVFQQYGLLPNLTIRENVEIGANLQSDPNKRLDVDTILEQIGLSNYMHKFPHELSGGQQQRTSIARAIAKNPTLLFGDEPTGAIDEEMSKMVLKQFVDINKTYNTTVIIVTHNPIFEELGSLVIKIKDGAISHLIRNENPKSVDELPWGIE